jgi:hypothetical protein
MTAKSTAKPIAVTWGSEKEPLANALWDDELQAAGAQVTELPAVNNRDCCDSAQKMTTLLRQTGFVSIKVSTESRAPMAAGRPLRL